MPHGACAADSQFSAALSHFMTFFYVLKEPVAGDEGG